MWSGDFILESSNSSVFFNSFFSSASLKGQVTSPQSYGTDVKDENGRKV